LRKQFLFSSVISETYRPTSKTVRSAVKTIIHNSILYQQRQHCT